MIVHCYLTNGFFPWAKIFLESFKFHNGIKNKVILSTRQLKNDQVDELYNLYENLEIRNSDFDYDWMAKKVGISVDKLLKLKKEVEQVHVTEKNKVWKLMIAADDRVKSTYEVLKDHQNEDYMLHSDIDMYIRRPLTELYNFIKKHDISIRLRLQSKINRKTMIGIQGYRICPKTIAFMERWIKYIDDVKPHARPLGYGQTSCYYAYRDFKDKVKWGSVPRRFIAPQMKPTDVIWSANTIKGKTENLRLCYADFEEMKNGTKVNNSI